MESLRSLARHMVLGESGIVHEDVSEAELPEAGSGSRAQQSKGISRSKSFCPL